MKNTTNKLDILSQYKDTSDLDNTNDLFQSNEYFTSNGGEIKHNPPLIKEWSNGVYSFNRNNDKPLPIADTIVNRLIQSYFSMIPLYKGKKTKRTERKSRRLSLNRILVSKPEIKHTNSKVIITVYLYNKNKKVIINKLKKLYKNFTLKLYKPLVNNKTSSISSRNKNNLNNKKFKARFPRLGPLFSKENKVYKASTGRTSVKNKDFKLAKNVIKNFKSFDNNINKPSLNINVDTRLNKDFSSLDVVNKNNTYNKENLSSLDTAKLNLILKNKFNKGQITAYGVDTKRIIIMKNKKKLPKTVKGTLVLAVTDKTTKTHNKKISKRRIKNSNFLKTTYNAKFASRLKTRLSRFIFNSVDKSNKNNNLSLKNKYALLVNKYYSLTNKYKLYSEEILLSHDNNYYIYYNNILKNHTNTNLTGLNPNNNSLLMGHGLKNNQSIFMPSSPACLASETSKARVKTLKNVKHIKNIMQKLRGYYKLFYVNSTYNSSEVFFNNGWVETAKQKYLHKLLKNPLIVSNYLNKKTVSSGLKQRSKINKRDNLLLGRKKIKTITQKGIEVVKRVRRHKNFLFRILKWNDNNFINYENKFYNKYIKKVYSKELLYLYYIKMLSLNTVRFKNWFLIGLKKVISKLYNKKVEFNFVNLKTIYLNSDIFSQAISVKLKNRKNGLLPVLKKALTLVNIPSIKNVLFNDNNTNHNSKQIELGSIKNILNTVKYKSVFGVRFEVAGRLSRRLTASRSVFKLRYKGSLKNIESVYKNKPITILRGNLKSNIQYTNVNTKTRNGAFGLKGWVSSY